MTKLRWLMMIGVALLAACGPTAVVNQTAEIAQGKWAFEDAKTFSAQIADTLKPVNYKVQVRHGGNYPYRNLIVYFKTYYPNNTYMIDTINCPLAAASGKWHGSGLGDLFDNEVLFKINQRFPQSGTYNFEIQHAMRPDTIEEIYDIGVLIESAMD